MKLTFCLRYIYRTRAEPKSLGSNRGEKVRGTNACSFSRKRSFKQTNVSYNPREAQSDGSQKAARVLLTWSPWLWRKLPGVWDHPTFCLGFSSSPWPFAADLIHLNGSLVEKWLVAFLGSPITVEKRHFTGLTFTANLHKKILCITQTRTQCLSISPC